MYENNFPYGQLADLSKHSSGTGRTLPQAVGIPNMVGHPGSAHSHLPCGRNVKSEGNASSHRQATTGEEWISVTGCEYRYQVDGGGGHLTSPTEATRPYTADEPQQSNVKQNEGNGGQGQLQGSPGTPKVSGASMSSSSSPSSLSSNSFLNIRDRAYLSHPHSAFSNVPALTAPHHHHTHHVLPHNPSGYGNVHGDARDKRVASNNPNSAPTSSQPQNNSGQQPGNGTSMQTGQQSHQDTSRENNQRSLTNNDTNDVNQQSIRQADKSVVVPADPTLWNGEHVKQWLEWAIREYSLQDVDPSRFPYVGRELCQLNKDDFSRITNPYNSEVLYAHLNFLRQTSDATLPPSTRDKTQLGSANSPIHAATTSSKYPLANHESHPLRLTKTESSYKGAWSSASSTQAQGYGHNAIPGMTKPGLDAHSHPHIRNMQDPYQVFGPTSSRLASSGDGAAKVKVLISGNRTSAWPPEATFPTFFPQSPVKMANREVRTSPPLRRYFQRPFQISLKGGRFLHL